MGKRYVEHNTTEPPDKKLSLSTTDIKSGTILVDILGNKWKLGKTVGTGGFGDIYLATDNIGGETDFDAPFVAKVESHTSGPLFVEIHCYLRMGKLDAIKKWRESNKMQHVAIPHYVAYGSHTVGDNKYRFLILPRYEKDLQQIFDIKQKFNLKTVLTIGFQIVDSLEYLHSHGYVHSDIKASNILYNEYKSKKSTTPSLTLKSLRYHGCRPMRTCKARKIQRVLRTNFNLQNVHINEEDEENTGTNIDQIYLLDYGLASKYVLSNGEHKSCDFDNRKAHAGTILFCSRDAHKGAQSRRSDLECLGYNLIYWLTSDLPWSQHASDPEMVHKKKCKCIQNLKTFLECSFNFDYPRFLYDYFNYLTNLEFEVKPDYKYIKNLFKKALYQYGYKDNLLLDFDNCEGWGRKQKKVNSENNKNKHVMQLLRTPLKSNLPVRPTLRKEVNKKLQRKSWSYVLDPEVIIKNAKNRERKLTDTSDSNASNGIQNLDINALNPTSAMIDVFNKSMERINMGGHSPRDRGDNLDTYIEGYTPAMIEVYNRMKEREYQEYQNTLLEAKQRSRSKKTKKRNNRQTKTSDLQVERQTANKKDCKVKSIPMKRTYSLRG